MMAASSTTTATTIRVRLHFDYPPPAVADCRMCWVLVDLHRCRLVADLESVIRDRFHFGRKSVLSLFVEDCYLPHTESILVVRDNDTVRVKVDTLAQVNGCSSHPETSKDKSSKRARCTEDDGSPTENGETVKKKNKKKKKEKVGEEAMEAESKAPGDDDNDTQTKKKHKKKKKKTKMAEPEKTAAIAAPKPTTSKPRPANDSQPAKSTATASVNTKGKTQASQRVSSSDSSDSSSEEDKAPKKTPSQKAAPKTTSSTPTLPKPPPKAAAPSVSSSETDSSCDEAPKKAALKNAKPVPSSSTALNGATGDKKTSSKPPPGSSSSSQPAHSSPTPRAGNVSEKAESADSDSSSEEEIRLVIKRPNVGLGFGLGPDAVGGPPSARGRGRGNVRGVGGAVERGRGRGGGRDGIRTRGGGRDAGRGRGHVNLGFNYDEVYQQHQQQQPSYQTDSLTNESVVLQNPEESTPKRDYSAMPLLAAPPPVGQSIAFKLLELTDNYTPEVSEYKEGKIVSFDPVTKQIQLELLSASRAYDYVEPGKFDLVYTNADGTVDRVESAVTRSSQVAERWESLLEPRLIIN